MATRPARPWACRNGAREGPRRPRRRRSTIGVPAPHRARRAQASPACAAPQRARGAVARSPGIDRRGGAHGVERPAGARAGSRGAYRTARSRRTRSREPDRAVRRARPASDRVAAQRARRRSVPPGARPSRVRRGTGTGTRLPRQPARAGRMAGTAGARLVRVDGRGRGRSGRGRRRAASQRAAGAARRHFSGVGSCGRRRLRSFGRTPGGDGGRSRDICGQRQDRRRQHVGRHGARPSMGRPRRADGHPPGVVPVPARGNRRCPGDQPADDRSVDTDGEGDRHRRAGGATRVGGRARAGSGAGGPCGRGRG